MIAKHYAIVVHKDVEKPVLLFSYLRDFFGYKYISFIYCFYRKLIYKKISLTMWCWTCWKMMTSVSGLQLPSVLLGMAGIHV